MSGDLTHEEFCAITRVGRLAGKIINGVLEAAPAKALTIGEACTVAKFIIAHEEPTPDPRDRVVKAARALKFGGYPAHGSGFVMIVTAGDINELADALRSLDSAKTE